MKVKYLDDIVYNAHNAKKLYYYYLTLYQVFTSNKNIYMIFANFVFAFLK